MTKLKVLSIFGTRPEAVKMAPVVSALKRNSDKITSKILVTAQHREMLDQFLSFFSITPDYDLDIMEKKQTLSKITCKILEGAESILQDEKPDIILVQGDTTTVFAASLAAFYQNIKVGHVEAGLRTDDKYNPFPEEINRRMAGVLADLHFAPTGRAKKNLLSCGTPENGIFITGNTVIDALFEVISLTDKKGGYEIPCKLNNGNRIIFVETHRRENWGEPIANICSAIKKIIKNFSDVEIVFSRP